MTFEEELQAEKNPSIIKIGEYLQERAKDDQSIARNLEKEKKSLKECWKYILGEAYKNVFREGGVGSSYIAPDEVYGLAVHYYDEDEIKTNQLNGVSHVKCTSKKEDSVKKKAEKKAKASIKKVKDGLPETQMSLFEL